MCMHSLVHLSTYGDWGSLTWCGLHPLQGVLRWSPDPSDPRDPGISEVSEVSDPLGSPDLMISEVSGPLGSPDPPGILEVSEVLDPDMEWIWTPYGAVLGPLRTPSHTCCASPHAYGEHAHHIYALMHYGVHYPPYPCCPVQRIYAYGIGAHIICACIPSCISPHGGIGVLSHGV